MSRNQSTSQLNIRFFHSLPYTEAKLLSRIKKRKESTGNYNQQLNEDLHLGEEFPREIPDEMYRQGGFNLIISRHS